MSNATIDSLLPKTRTAPILSGQAMPTDIVERDAPGANKRTGDELKDISQRQHFGLLDAIPVLGFAAILALGIVTGASSAEDSGKVVGLWRLVSYEVEVRATGAKDPVMGQKPTGYASFSPEGRVFFVLTGDGRKPAATDQERPGLQSTLVAYTGTYRIEDDKWITKVDVAWDPAWIGTEQRRSFEINGDRMEVTTPWRLMPNWADKGMTRSIITFERAK